MKNSVGVFLFVVVVLFGVGRATTHAAAAITIAATALPATLLGNPNNDKSKKSN